MHDATVTYPVQDKHSGSAGGTRSAGCNGRIVVEAEAHGHAALGVVARRTHDGGGAACLACSDGDCHINACARRETAGDEISY